MAKVSELLLRSSKFRTNARAFGLRSNRTPRAKLLCLAEYQQLPVQNPVLSCTDRSLFPRKPALNRRDYYEYRVSKIRPKRLRLLTNSSIFCTLRHCVRLEKTREIENKMFSKLLSRFPGIRRKIAEHRKGRARLHLRPPEIRLRFQIHQGQGSERKRAIFIWF